MRFADQRFAVDIWHCLVLWEFKFRCRYALIIITYVGPIGVHEGPNVHSVGKHNCQTVHHNVQRDGLMVDSGQYLIVGVCNFTIL